MWCKNSELYKANAGDIESNLKVIFFAIFANANPKFFISFIILL